MNAKETLKKLHEVFPNFDTDTLLKILDCYVEEIQISNPIHIERTPYITWDDTCSYIY